MTSPVEELPVLVNRNCPTSLPSTTPASSFPSPLLPQLPPLRLPYRLIPSRPTRFVILLCLRQLVAGTITFNGAVVASTVGMWLQHDLKDLGMCIPKLVKIMEPVHRVAALLSSKPRIEQDPDETDPVVLARRVRPQGGKFKGAIEFQEVDWSHPSERQKQVLRGLSFKIEPGQKVAFVGKTGCGKSSSVALLQR